MERQDFIMTLFDGGNGLTLDQITTIEKYLPDTIPNGMLEDIARDIEEDVNSFAVTENALYQARDVFMERLHDCNDMLELKDVLDGIIENVTDMQVYRVWLITREV